MDVLLPTVSEITTADAWFAGLDRRRLTIGAMQFTMQVLGVHVDAFNTWIQIELSECPGSSLLLRLIAGATSGDAVNILRSAVAARIGSDAPTEPVSNDAGECRHVFLTIAPGHLATP